MQIDQAFPSRGLRAADLGGIVVPVVIDRLEQELVGRDKELKPILYFRGKARARVHPSTVAGGRGRNRVSPAPVQTTLEGEGLAGTELC